MIKFFQFEICKKSAIEIGLYTIANNINKFDFQRDNSESITGGFRFEFSMQ